MRFLVVAIALSCVSCTEPASTFDDGLRHVPTELEIRRSSADLYQFATSHWRFYDDFLDLQPPACGPDTDGGVAEWSYLWRHGVASSSATAEGNGRLYGGRAGLDISPSGILAVAAAYRLWTFAADGGQPLHADWSDARGGGWTMGAFATPTLFWTDGALAPSLYDFALPRSRVDGWQVAYSWRAAQGSTNSFDNWYQASPAIQRDGTLIWTSGAGTTFALGTNGELKWTRPADQGPLLVTIDDIVVRSTRGDFVAFAPDGGVLWHEPTLGDGGALRQVPIVDEGRYPSRFLPMYYGYGEAALVLRDARDGRVAARLDAGAFATPVVVGVDPDGWVLLNGQEADSSFSLAALTPELREVWRVPAQELEFAPIVTPTRVVTIDRDCRLKLIDRTNGTTLAEHRLVGRPYRYLPRLLDGVLYVTAEVRPTVTTKPSQMQGRVRPDGGIIDVADYGCFLPGFLDTDLCPAIAPEPRQAVYAVYAFQVE
ncbi:MAG: hypothetical protein U0228_37440 [Myxococcaceae bacterium]